MVCPDRPMCWEGNCVADCGEKRARALCGKGTMMRPNRTWATCGNVMCGFVVCVLSIVPLTYGDASGLMPPAGTRYRLVEGSTLIDECTNCGRPPIPVPITGSFVFELTGSNPLFDFYAVRNLQFHGSLGDRQYSGRLEGDYQIGGEVSYFQQMTLDGWVEELNPIAYDSGFVPVTEPLPWIVIDVKQVKPDPYGPPYQRYNLHLVAVPWPQVWFSTEVGFTSSDKSIGPVSDGDLLSADGRIVRRNSELTARLGIQPIVPDLGLDAVMRPVSAASCCEIWFSLEEDVFSERLGPLHHGDILSDRIAIVRTNSELLAAFGVMPMVEDAGLDALAARPDGKILFSTEKDFFSETLGRKISHGDLLCEDGTIYKTQAELLAHFQPAPSGSDSFGLDAAFVWPNGEVWFSVGVDFTDKQLGTIRKGDLLSDRGRIVMTNLDLLRLFGPIEDMTDFGLDALEITEPRPVGDLDFNCRVDFYDFTLFAQEWLWTDCDACRGADFTGDATVNEADLLLFVEHWLQSCTIPEIVYDVQPCNRPAAPGAGTDLRFTVEVQGRFLLLKDPIVANCCDDKIELAMEVQGDEITVRETEFVTHPCFCICTYPTTAQLGPFEPGRYTLAVWQDSMEGNKFLGTVEVIISD